MKRTDFYKDYLRYYKPKKKVILFSLILSLIQSLISLTILKLIKSAFDNWIPSHNMQLTAVAGIIICFLYLANGSVSCWIRYIVLKMTKSVISSFRKEILDKIYLLPKEYFNKADQKKLTSMIVQDSERIDIMSNAVLGQFLPAIFMAMALTGMLFYMNHFLFSILMIFFPLTLAVHEILGRKVKNKTCAFHRSFESFHKGIARVFQLIDLTRIQNAEEEEIRKQSKKIEELRSTSQDMSWIRTVYIQIQNVLISCSGIVILIAGGKLVSAGQMTLGDFIAFYTASTLLISQLHMISFCIPQIIEGESSLFTLYEWFNFNLPLPYQGKSAISFRGGLAFKNISFNFENTQILNTADFEINPNELIVLTGINGSGKSTIVNLILGFYRPQGGEILVENVPMDSIDIEKIRQKISLVRQDPIIFPGTIFENLTYGCPDLSRQDVMQASELACSHDFISKLSEGYDSPVGEDCDLISGGQAQLISIARAILKKPKLIILDEPTNHLDDKVTGKLISNLSRLKSNLTILVVSHHPKMLEIADKILYLKNGQITSFNNHSDYKPDES